jgi:ubiquinone/menaquinone biosynthesis C-methylase UbiE
MSSKPYFEKVASDWDTMRKGFFPDSVREKAIEQITLREGTKVADIGAGTGFITEGLCKAPVSVYAIDESEDMLEVMQQKFASHKNIHYIQSESEAIQLEDKAIDYALANMYLHHVEQPAKAIAEIYRILKPSGKLVITDLDEHNHTFLKTEHHDRWMGFDRKAIENWYKAAGFKNVKIDCLNSKCCSDACGSDERAEISIFIAVGEK